MMADWELPDSISPSRMSLWQQCPLKFRVESMQKLRGSTNAAAVAGTTIHLALEWLMQLNGPERTHEALEPLILQALAEIRETEDYQSLTEDELKGFDAKVKRVTPRLFDMIDVPRAKVVSTEMRLEVMLDGWILRGIIDLLLGSEERPYVWDHKSGKTPSKQYQGKAMEGIQFYAVMIELHLGVIPAKIALGYLDSRTKIVAEPSPRSVQATRSKILATRDSIATACDTGHFPTKTSKLCDWCQLKSVCPAHGGSEDDIQTFVELRS
jgi:putative RecB family exonuclease